MTADEFMTACWKEEKVGIVPGTCFGNQGENHIRISYAASRENIAEALKRIGHFVYKHKNKSIKHLTCEASAFEEEKY